MGNKFSKWTRNVKKKDNNGVADPTPIPSPLPQTPNIQESPKKKIIAKAIYTYQIQNEDDLGFKTGDRMLILSQTDQPWWLAEHTQTKQRGYIPSNYIVIEDGKPSSLDAWFDINRQEAEKFLLRMGNPDGTYIIRPCGDSRNLVLSVRYQKDMTLWSVMHYKIKFLDNDEGFYITPSLSFPLLVDLINYYSKRSDLCTRLSIPCPRVIKPPVQFRDLEVARSSITMVDSIGRGSFGEVYRAKWNNVLEVAVKTLRQSTAERYKFIKEAEIMHRLNHPKIVQILGICTEPVSEPMYIITELMCNGALLDYLKNYGEYLKFDHLMDILAQVAEGMAYLESMHFVHRDLRAANILVGSENDVKVADFGLALVMNEESIYEGHEESKFPIKWTAPEAASGPKHFSVKSDVWSFGVLVYEVITYGATLYPGMNHKQVIYKICNGYRLPNPNGTPWKHGVVSCPPNLYDIMIACWDSRPENRYTFEHLREVFKEYTVNITDIHYEQQIM